MLRLKASTTQTILGSAVALALLYGGAVQAQTATVKVLSIVDHPALDAIRDGVRDELKAAGYDADKNLKWEYQSAQGNPGTAAQIGRASCRERV